MEFFIYDGSGSSPFYVLAGKQRQNFIGRVRFVWNGTVWLERNSKTSKVNAKAHLNAITRKGQSICIFPEKTWNLTPVKPLLLMKWGVIELPQSNQVPLVPICFEYIAARLALYKKIDCAYEMSRVWGKKYRWDG